MTDRERFTQDGREWFEPSTHDLVVSGHITYLYPSDSQSPPVPAICRICGQPIKPGTVVRLNIERTRTWTKADGFSAWSPWQPISLECHDHADPVF